MGSFSIWELLIVLAIVILLFGTKKLKNIGTDLGGAIRGFRKSMNDDGKDEPIENNNLEDDTTIESSLHSKDSEHRHS